MEVYLDDRVIEVNEKALIKAQAAWRGAVVRKKMKVVHQMYEDIFSDIEDSPGADPWFSGYLKNMKPDATILWKRSPRNTNRTETDANSITITDENDSQTISQNGMDTERIEVQSERVVPLPSVESSENFSDIQKDISADTDKAINISDSSPVKYGADGSKMGNETSVWDSVDVTQHQKNDMESTEQERQQIVMELLWVQQAINSRKQYLRLKDEIS